MALYFEITVLYLSSRDKEGDDEDEEGAKLSLTINKNLVNMYNFDVNIYIKKRKICVPQKSYVFKNLVKLGR